MSSPAKIILTNWRIVQYQDFVIDLMDLRKRVDNSTYKVELQKDFDQEKITCPLWTTDGSLVSPTLQDSRMFKFLMQAKNLGSLEDYRRKWVACFDGALDVANNKQSAPTGTFDVLSRFYNPSNKTEFRLCFMPGTLLDGTPVRNEMLQSAIAAASAYSKSVDPIIYPEDEATARKNGLVMLSANPLGLYTTWIEQETRNNLRRLVRAQTSSDSWVRTGPTMSQAETFNKEQSEKLNYHFDSLRDKDVQDLLQFPGDKLVNHRRINTKDIMGDSANQVLTL
ncbi:hypothetical protein FRC10_001711 [Ceratobasidium sp. 414]|nr:hypothetical protein FRC10_001711 [Ceratobasidium sp. 414]